MSVWKMDDLRRYLAALETGDPDRQLTHPDDDVQIVRFAIERIEELEKRLKQASTFNPDWDRLDAAEESLREHMRLLKNARARIEKLESALKIISGRQQCADNLMGNKEIAEAALEEKE